MRSFARQFPEIPMAQEQQQNCYPGFLNGVEDHLREMAANVKALPKLVAAETQAVKEAGVVGFWAGAEQGCLVGILIGIAFGGWLAKRIQWKT
jgi:hypothetical protein